jgi:CubicO group peptidase (beta-lactamase class C family)
LIHCDIEIFESAPPMRDDAEERIARVVADLRPATPFPRRKTAASSLARRMANYATPGASIAVIDGGEVAWERGFGTREVGRSEPVEADTLFQAGSISKLAFALGAMRLVEMGAITLDDDIQQFLTSWRIPANGDWTPRITLRQLLSHSAGTTIHGFPGYPASGPWPTLVQVLEGLPPANNLPVVVDLIPGLQFRYSGGGTTIAQAAVTDALGRPLAESIEELVFKPLGLTSSTFAQPLPEDLALRAAAAHPWNATPLAGRWRVYPETAAAGLWTTAGDLARIGVDFLRALKGQDCRLGLSAESAAQMLRPQIHGDQEGDDYVGLAWWCSGKDRAFQCSHSGWNEGYIAGLWIYPNTGQGAVVMINSNQGDELVDEIRAAIAREYGWPEPQTERAAQPLPPGVAGKYRTDSGVDGAISIFEGNLKLQIENQAPIAFLQIESRFVSDDVNATLEILPSSEGRHVLLLTQADRKFRFEKQC